MQGGLDGPTGLGKTVVSYAKAIANIHRERCQFFSIVGGVVVELTHHGTFKAPLATPI
jgi:hypothetical protein